MVARDCGGIGIVVAVAAGGVVVVDDAANASVGEARAVVVMAVAMDTKDSMASRRDGCCGSFASWLCLLKLSFSSWLPSSSS